MSVTGHKFCKKCKSYKTRDEFGSNPRLKDGLHSYCRECNNAYSRAYQKNQRSNNKLLTERVSELERELIDKGEELDQVESELKKSRMMVYALQRILDLTNEPTAKEAR